ncbi:ABC transporter ATP-binding protein [Cohnella herbarum]|uniref:ABC transporter ATP-binding protein n=1 Tax=Cohnella herbarum TaxID=2728023 RepID=A0A7Z2VFY6_9BACL|nr:ABC transporter ATP-binding protein [Cohnella herbarum]QJD82200.1 ABC transporter ATP-binding protein [Cohnella herbarum]
MAHQSTEDQPIIQLDNVTFRYPGAQIDSLYQVNLSISRGDFIAIAGSNGSGKTTLCKCFNGLIPGYYSGDMEGTIVIDGFSASERSVAELSKSVAYVFQDFENQLVRPTVYDEACFAPLNFGYEDYKERGLHALEMLEIEHLRNEWIWQLSGGQKHMAALAAALALNPEVIVVDEPVAQLDPAHARMIYDKLKLLNEKYGKTIVVIEHHTEFIADYCRKIVLMEKGGRVRWVKTVSEGLSAVADLNEMNIQPPQVTQAFHALRGVREAERGIPYPITIEEAVAHWAPILKRATFPSIAAKQESAAPTSKETLVRFDKVVSGYQGIDRKKRPIIRELDLSIHDGDRIALIGNNGAGKSTLLRLISGLRRPWEGAVTVCGQDTRKTSPEKLADQVAFLFQNPEEMFIADNIREDVAYFLKARKQEGIEAFVDEVLGRFKLTDLQERDGRLLSGGQQRRASLAIGMAMRPTVMLLDEPTASLDIASRKEMTLLFEELHDHVKAVIVATHDMQLVADWANRVIVMNEGRILLDTDSSTVFQHPEILDKAALVAPQIIQLCQRLDIVPACLSVQQFITYMQHAPREEFSYGSR